MRVSLARTVVHYAESEIANIRGRKRERERERDGEIEREREKSVGRQKKEKK